MGGAALVFTVVPNPNRKNVGETVSAMGITIRMHLSRGGVEVTEVMDPVGTVVLEQQQELSLIHISLPALSRRRQPHLSLPVWTHFFLRRS